MHPWMLTAPQATLPESATTAFQAAWDARDPALLPTKTPHWMFLHWLQEQGVLFHGSPQAGLKVIRPQVKDYRQPDDFSNRFGVYATSVGHDVRPEWPTRNRQDGHGPPRTSWFRLDCHALFPVPEHG